MRAGARNIMASAVKAGNGVMEATQRALAVRKYGLPTFRAVLKAAAEFPNIAVICKRTGVARDALRYWLTMSRERSSDSLFDIPTAQGRTERFHVLWEDAIQEGMDKADATAFRLATGTFREALHHHGHVTYKTDPQLIALGLKGEEAYLKDENGDLVPESIPIVDPEMVRWLLARRRPEIYGAKQQINVDHTHRGGFVIQRKTAKQLDDAYGGKPVIDVVEFEVIDDEEPKP